MKSSENFAAALEKEGFQRYIPQNNDQVIMNDSSSYADQLNEHVTKYNLDRSNIATFIFSAISNTQSDKIFFSYDEMKNFILQFSSTKPKHLVKDIKWVLEDLTSLRTDNTTLPLLFEKTNVDVAHKIVTLCLSPSSSFIFGTTAFRNKQVKND